MVTKIKVSKVVHSFVCNIVKDLSVKLLAKGYTVQTCDAALFSKISQSAFVNMAHGMFENGLTVNAAADNIINTLQL